MTRPRQIPASTAPHSDGEEAPAHHRTRRMGLMGALFVAGLTTGLAIPAVLSGSVPAAGEVGGRSRTETSVASRVGGPQHAAVALGARSDVSGRPRSVATLPPGTPRDFDLFWQAMRIVQEHYVDRDAASDTAITRGAIEGMVEALGDIGHSVYLTPDEVRAEQDALDGKVIGIGVLIDDRAGRPIIISVIDGSPADAAGLRAGDVIVEVDGRSIDRVSLEELLTRVRGAKGTRVRLGVERPGTNGSFPVEVTRAEVLIPAASWAMVPGTRIAAVRLVQFSQGSGALVRDAVREALDAGATGIVLDLRGNPGGLVDEAVSVTGAFLADGVVYRQRDRDGRETEVTVRGRAVAPDAPLVVLADYGSASSAEIVAAGLRDNGRARIVGEQTFGTGTVLNAFALRDGSALRLGVLRWLTPTGEDIFGQGVRPDVVVERDAGEAALEPGDLLELTAAEFAAGGDRQLQRAVELLTASPEGPAPA